MKASKDISFTVKTTEYDTSYLIGKNTRASTNFANFARDPDHNKQRISTFLELVNRDLNRILASSITHRRYEIRLEILSIYGHITEEFSSSDILLTEVMRASVLDQHNDCLYPGPTGLIVNSNKF
ncbi:hypothetical protein AWQ21_12075 [Picosynechococcus sp. PCC 7003]|uniref:putative oxygenase MesX n=1 Tax=Picosynechococcus sp. PCC 7003 TaxID=374981 RepID=UPI0008109969|nr:hypothetical protein AWQ21_12075 [Picosynechococcus sp. PCC 7003]